jgi:hypothetical protein
VKSLITTTRTSVITVFLFIILFTTSTPYYFVSKLGFTFSQVRNKTIVGLISSRNREQVEKITFTINNFLIPICAFAIIVVCTAVLSMKLRSSTKWRHTTTNSSQVEKVSNRSQKTSKMVVMVSTLFISCFIPVNINMLVIGFIPELSVGGKYMSLSVIICGLGYVLESINSSMNIFIYYYMSSKYRESFLKLFFQS